MGHDIEVISKHNLNLNNLEDLAKDICSRLDINIEYGYLGYDKHLNHSEEKDILKFVELGKVFKKDNFNTFKLVDYNYQNISELKLYSEEIGNLDIYRNTYKNNISYISRWWDFCHFFTRNYLNDLEYYEKLIKFRKEIMHYSFSLGGNKVFYLDDNEAIGQGYDIDSTWEDYEEYVLNQSLNLCLNIPRYLKDEDYRSKFLVGYTDEVYPLSFVDDFSDLLNQ